MDNKFNYAVIRHNNPYQETKTALLDNKYNPEKKYSLEFISTHKDGTESITCIEYSNDLEALHNKVIEFQSWFNYPIHLCKTRKGDFKTI